MTTVPVEQQFPMMRIQITPAGILLSIVRSTFEKQDIIIPESYADTAVVDWLASRPTETKRDILKRLMTNELKAVK